MLLSNLQYIQYSKLKRIIKRMRFIADGNAASNKSDAEMPQAKSGGGAVQMSAIAKLSEYSLLQPSSSVTSGHTFHETSHGFVERHQPHEARDDESDFFTVIQMEIDKINKFFVG
jgi:hypothetical protein